MSNGNREYKSDVFSMLMMDKKNALSVYNALNHSNITDTEELEMCTLDGGFSLTVRNDAAFVVDAKLSIYEHQSTVCPNIPFRSLVYYTVIVKDLIRGKNLFGRSQIKLPTPQFVIFYNGSEEQPEEYEMKLSDSFLHPTEDPQLELKCKVYNINYGKNKQFLENCQVLREYSIFVEYVRSYHKEQNYDMLDVAIDRAITQCIKEGILSDFLDNNRFEVIKVMQMDYSFEKQILMEREDAHTEGLAEGKAEGLAEGKAEGLAEGKAEGRAEGRAEGKAEAIKNIVSLMSEQCPDEAALLSLIQTKTSYKDLTLEELRNYL